MASNRATWDERTTKLFLDLCIQEKNRFNANDKGQQTGKKLDNKQLQNKLGGLRRAYITWRDLQSRTGLGRDTQTGGIAADDSYWANEEGVHEEEEEGDTSAAAANCGKPPKFLEELELLFGRTTQDRGVLLSAGGVRGRTPNSGPEDHPEHTPTDLFQHSSDQYMSKRPMREESVDSPRKKMSTSLEVCLKDISEAVTRRSRKSIDDVEGQDQVRQILDADGISEGSQLYLRALYLCKNAVNRKQFVGMRTKEGREEWINFNWEAMGQFHQR
ncbi:hypothetical protein BS78_08G029200 [Paspalum vaginatum]|nr:hypothetical protein BS78_08G029200 [Paspalum vaginatum]